MGVFHTSALDNNNNNSSSRTATATIAGLGRRHRHRHRRRPDTTSRHLLNSIFALTENPHQRGPSRLLPESQTGRGQSTAPADWQHPIRLTAHRTTTLVAPPLALSLTTSQRRQPHRGADEPYHYDNYP